MNLLRSITRPRRERLCNVSTSYKRSGVSAASYHRIEIEGTKKGIISPLKSHRMQLRTQAALQRSLELRDSIGQARSPRPDPEHLLVRQMTSHIPDPCSLCRGRW